MKKLFTIAILSASLFGCKQSKITQEIYAPDPTKGIPTTYWMQVTLLNGKTEMIEYCPPAGLEWSYPFIYHATDPSYEYNALVINNDDHYPLERNVKEMHFLRIDYKIGPMLDTKASQE